MEKEAFVAGFIVACIFCFIVVICIIPGDAAGIWTPAVVAVQQPTGATIQVPCVVRYVVYQDGSIGIIGGYDRTKAEQVYGADKMPKEG